MWGSNPEIPAKSLENLEISEKNIKNTGSRKPILKNTKIWDNNENPELTAKNEKDQEISVKKCDKFRNLETEIKNYFAKMSKKGRLKISR